MRLKRLIIIGFKSFADKTVLSFDQGITCIVGPNGCGKSNISDAFRWVMGEQSAKSLRGVKMPDVIFAGTTHRKPLNFAEVSLTLTDLKGALPIDYEEITLTRRLHRNGESEYLINGNLVRLKDVQSLFLDSGIGKNAFSIFEQGKLDQVISYSPQERRTIFEEAAGILRFLQRKREAFKRLEQADDNYTRVKDIHQEVEKQIQVLEVQAEKALQFKQQKSQLEQHEKNLYVYRWKGTEKKQEALRVKASHLCHLLEESEQELKSSRESVFAFKEEIQAKEKELKGKQAELYQQKNEKQILALESENNQKKGEELKRKELKLKNEREELFLSRQTRLEQLNKIAKQEKELAAEFSLIEGSLHNQLEKLKEKEQEVAILKTDSQTKQQAHLKAVQAENLALSDFKQTEIRLENLKEGKKLLEKRKEEMSVEFENHSTIIYERKKHLQQLSGLVDTHKERLDHYETEIKHHVQELEKGQKDLEGRKKLFFELKAREKILLKMREDLEGFSSATKQLLLISQTIGSPFFNKIRPLYEYLSPAPEAAEAVAIALRHYGQTLVIEENALFHQLIQFAEEEGLHEYSLICLENLKSPLSSVRSLAEKVAGNPVSTHLLQNAIWGVSLEDAFSLSDHLEAITDKGGYLDSKKVYFKTKLGETQVFIRETELKNIEEKIIEQEDQLKVLEQSLLLLSQNKKQLELERSEADKMLRRDEMKLVEINFGLQRALGDMEKLRCEEEQLKTRWEASELHSNELKNKLQQSHEIHARMAQETLHLSKEFENISLRLNQEEQTLHAYLKEHQEKGVIFRTLSERKSKLLHQRDLLDLQEKEHESRAERLEEELEEGQAHFAEVQKKEKEFACKLLEMEDSLEKAQKVFQELELMLEKLQASKQELESLAFRQEEQCKKKEGELAQIKIAEAQMETLLEGFQNEAKERYDWELSELSSLELPADLSIEQVEKAIRSLKSAIQAAGAINLASIEDLENLRIRYDFLSRQLEDMKYSKEELLHIIQSLDSECRKLFKASFEAIRANFKKNFNILFNGGEADLQFTETEDILEAGIEISAKPPGKQMRSISLLSGGEKCLTAVALLFAIFEVKPAPFCILDEIDAPLDDSNVERFVNVVKHFATRCQFLIITHNKRTMAIGDILFGVSMEEKGVSKLLSLEFTHEKTPQLALI